MKPFQILLYLLSVFLVLLLVATVFPSTGIKISSESSLKFMTLDEIFNSEEVEYADISGIIDNASAAEEIPSGTEVPGEAPEGELPVMDTIRANPDSLKKITWLIEFPRNDPSYLYRLFSRFSKLKDKKELVRIMHYGDSQIEADRMTSFIRHKLQLTFGGSGCGFIPPVPLYNGKMSIKQENSSIWQRYTGFMNRDTTLGHEKFGPLFSFCSYSQSDTGTAEKAWLNYSPSPIGYSSSRRFNNIALYVGGSQSNASMEVFVDDSLWDSFEVREVDDFIRFNWRIPHTPKDLRIEFAGQPGPEVYGISIDNDWGVAVDNIPLRGSSGLVFSKNDTVFLRKMYEKLNVGMLILQFGGNLVPEMSKSYGYYERFLKREFKLIKRMLPGVPVIVIGPSDMSMKDKGKYITYPSLEKVRDAMRKASLESGFAFWDMYRAMGGKNSMPSWVFAEPPLAISDFVHLNPRGARIMGEMFYNAFIYEYKRWQTETDLTAQKNMH